jgi:glutamyl-tRNA synthetase
MELDELVAAFSMERVLKKSAVFDVDKLMWLNGKRLAEKPASELLAAVGARLEAVTGLDRARLEDAEWMSRLVDLLKSRARTIDDLADQAVPFVADDLEYEDKAIAKHWAKDPAVARERLQGLAALWAGGDWTEEKLEDSLRGLAERLGIGAGKLIHPLRVALTGRMSSPGIFEVLLMLGRDRSLHRIALGIERTSDL